MATRRRPTPAELQALRALWELGPATVRQVHEALYSDSAVAYTTTLKLLQNLHAKGLVSREAEGKRHLYRARADEDSTLRGVVRQMVDRVFGGSGATLAMHALADRRVSPRELADLKAMIRTLETTEEE